MSGAADVFHEPEQQQRLRQVCREGSSRSEVETLHLDKQQFYYEGNRKRGRAATGGHAGADLCFHRKQARVKAADLSGLAIIRAPDNRALMSSG